MPSRSLYVSMWSQRTRYVSEAGVERAKSTGQTSATAQPTNAGDHKRQEGWFVCRLINFPTVALSARSYWYLSAVYHFRRVSSFQ